MELTSRELWTVIHGMVLGAAFLLAFAGGLAGLYSFRPELLTAGGVQERLPRLAIGTWVMALVAWATVYVGTFIVYPWYRDPAKTSPRSLLLADPHRAEWHNFGMEWKEHVAWVSPILATAVAFVVIYYGPRLAQEPAMRKILIALFMIAFGAAAVAGIFGAFINKAAPIL